MTRWLLLLCVTLVGVGSACKEHETRSNAEHAPSDWGVRVREAHELADHAKSAQQRTIAIVALRKVLQQTPDATTAQLRWVQQDLHFRLAQALFDDGELEDANIVIIAGLQVSSEPTVALANLLALQGKVLEAQGKSEQAAAVLHDALLINELLMERALAGEGERERH